MIDDATGAEKVLAPVVEFCCRAEIMFIYVDDVSDNC